MYLQIYKLKCFIYLQGFELLTFLFVQTNVRLSVGTQKKPIIKNIENDDICHKKVNILTWFGYDNHFFICMYLCTYNTSTSFTLMSYDNKIFRRFRVSNIIIFVVVFVLTKHNKRLFLVLIYMYTSYY